MSRSLVAQVFAEEWPRVVATLRRDWGDLDLAEDVAADAFAEAARRWGPGDSPDRPGAWLVATARRKAIDRARRDRRFAERLPALADHHLREPAQASGLVDDQLALIFGCCHPSLAREAQVALTLREVAGLSTSQIAHAFLVSEPAMAKRLVRAKAKIRSANVPFAVPPPECLDDRLSAVLAVVYLVFTEGHTSTHEATLVRGDLCDEARWLAGLLSRLLPEHSEVLGLVALLAFTDARRPTRIDGDGALVLLEDQDRSRWDRAAIAQGTEVLARAQALGKLAAYQLQAAIAGAHSTAPSLADTNWHGIVMAYDQLLVLGGDQVVGLNRAIAVGMAFGPAAGLRAVGEVAGDGALDDFHYLHSTKAELFRQLGDVAQASASYDRALDLVTNDVEAAFLAARLGSLAAGGDDPSGR
ncbi:MAG: DUF6596 domain-containing protein [Microthrixaceae bacterium]